MADMATYNQVEECWDALEDLGIADDVIPVTYMNSSADIKAFTGRHGGTVCTSSNAGRALTWALSQRQQGTLPARPAPRPQHCRAGAGHEPGDCVVWDPHAPGETGGLTPDQLRDATMILWRGHCSVHGRFSPGCVTDVRERVPGVNVIVHPECQHEVVLAADYVGSTEKIISTIEQAPAGSAWAVGTELNLVQRLAAGNPDKTVVFLDKTVCYCSTMNRIDLPHLVWALESLAGGQLVNQITVDEQSAAQARAALERMLALPLPRRRRVITAAPPVLQARRAPDRHPAAEVRLDLEIGAQGAPDLQLKRVVALLAGQRRERVEGAPLVQVDQPERTPARVAERHDRAQQLRARTRRSPARSSPRAGR